MVELRFEGQTEVQPQGGPVSLELGSGLERIWILMRAG